MNLQMIEIFNLIKSMYPIPTLYQFCQSENLSISVLNLVQIMKCQQRIYTPEIEMLIRQCKKSLVSFLINLIYFLRRSGNWGGGGNPVHSRKPT